MKQPDSKTHSTTPSGKRSAPKLYASLACLLVLSACGGDSSDTDSDPSQTPYPAPAPTPAPAPAPAPAAEGSLYVTDRINGTVTRCSTDAANGAVQTCSAPITGFSAPTDITLNGNFAHVANFGDNSVSTCKTGTDGTLSDCANSGVTNLNSPTDVAVKGNNAYIVNYGANSVTRCTVDAATGAMSACADSGALGLVSPIGMDIRENTAYIANNADGSISQCAIDQISGNLACPSTKKYLTLGLASPYGITSNGTSLYIVNQGSNATATSAMTQSRITRCTIDATTGDLVAGSCVNEAQYTVPGTAPTDWYQANRMAIAGNVAYITNRNLGKVAQCAVDATSGALSTCTAAAAVLPGATGVAVK